MAFPTTSVIDDFNRANGPAGSNWTAPATGAGDSVIEIISNAAYAPINSNGGYWNPSTFGPDSEAYMSLPTSSGADASLLLRQTTPGTTANGYRFKWNTTFQRMNYFRVDAGALTQLGANEDGFAHPVSGDSVGCEVVGSILTGHIKFGGTWSNYPTRTDSTYSAAGNIGLFNASSAARMDDFGGGTVVANVSSNIAPGFLGRGAGW